MLRAFGERERLDGDGEDAGWLFHEGSDRGTVPYEYDDWSSVETCGCGCLDAPRRAGSGG
jgi:hypothetical protein